MNYNFTIFFIVLFVFSTISGACATDKTSDDMNDFSHYTIASKIAYATSWNMFRFYGSVVPANMGTMEDIADYFTQLGQRGNQDIPRPGYVVNVSTTDLNPGDVVHVKNSVYPFMIYKGQNKPYNDTDQIILESLMNRYLCDSDTFDQIFDGYAINFPSTPEQTQFAVVHSVNGSNITDDPIYDPSLGSPILIGDSLYVGFWNAHQFDPNSNDTAQLSNFYNTNLCGDYTTDVNKANGIFTWVQNHLGYSGTWVGTTWYSSFAIVIDQSGNSCDQARLVYALGKLAGLNVVFHKADCQFPAGQFAHVWTDIQVNGTWLSADTTSKQNMLGNTTFSRIITDYGQYDMLDC
jgi:hypothetical protein